MMMMMMSSDMRSIPNSEIANSELWFIAIGLIVVVVVAADNAACVKISSSLSSS